MVQVWGKRKSDPFNWCVIRNSKTNHRLCPVLISDCLIVKHEEKKQNKKHFIYKLVFDLVLELLTVSTVGIINLRVQRFQKIMNDM